jgi:hypothetical protein
MSELVRMIEIERERFEALAVRYSSEVQVCRHFAVLGGPTAHAHCATKELLLFAEYQHGLAFSASLC